MLGIADHNPLLDAEFSRVAWRLPNQESYPRGKAKVDRISRHHKNSKTHRRVAPDGRGVGA
jgi:hypothetical protein